ncbi:MAG: hypothetical protein C0183_03120 [Roseiflexus castenholzii]|uniref:DUF6615 family protein n=1 Tax=Roseiflexus castenholzii TaxID=120962 RepID=UPI000CAAEF07|nr:MAG: hypothetical protein C0183_03120 [Roseiflexus castenholzii]
MTNSNPLSKFAYLCSDFIRLNLKTGHDLYKARETEFRLGEDAVTDINLLDIASRHSDRVIVIRFNRMLESKGGADWAWWFLDQKNKAAVGFRIQAKILNWKNNQFDYLHYDDQTDKLIENAR